MIPKSLRAIPTASAQDSARLLIRHGFSLPLGLEVSVDILVLGLRETRLVENRRIMDSSSISAANSEEVSVPESEVSYPDGVDSGVAT